MPNERFGQFSSCSSVCALNDFYKIIANLMHIPSTQIRSDLPWMDEDNIIFFFLAIYQINYPHLWRQVCHACMHGLSFSVSQSEIKWRFIDPRQMGYSMEIHKFYHFHRNGIVAVVPPPLPPPPLPSTTSPQSRTKIEMYYRLHKTIHHALAEKVIR